MDSTAILELIDQLDDDVDDLEESLLPLLKTALSDSASKLPLLDKAKLYILVTYALESILFAYLRINGVKARDHPVFKELTRVKQYFDKIKVAEAPPEERTTTLDKGAAARFIKAGLSGNDRFDAERAEKAAKERARAHIKFQQLEATEKKRKAETKNVAEAVESDSSTSSEDDDEETSSTPKHKKQKVEEDDEGNSAKDVQKVKKSKGDKKKAKAAQDAASSEQDSSISKQSRKKNSKGKKKKKNKKSGTTTPQ